VSCRAVTDCQVLAIRRQQILPQVHDTPEVAAALVASACQRLHQLMGQIEKLKTLSGPQRIADFLLGLVPVAQGSCVVALPYEKELVAGKLGLKPESLSRAFKQLRAHGVVVKQNAVQISDIARLRRFAEGHAD
jgi:CRP-like cAMP-binding protein